MKQQRISNSLFIKNRSKLKNLLLPDSSLVVFSADEMPRNGDQYFPFRQSSDLVYLTGINQEKTVLVMSPQHHEEKYREALFIIKPGVEQETWYGHKLSLEEAAEISGIKNIFWLDDFEKILSEILFKSKNIYLNAPEHYKIKPDVDSRDERLGRKIQAAFPLHSFHRLAPLLCKLRMIKEPEEIELIKQACNITKDAFLRVLDFVKPGVMEYEVEAEITHEFLRLGASGHAYDAIIAGGKNACILHYVDNCDRCKDGELLLMDFGAEYANYAADLTRTIPVNGKFTKRQAQVYDSNLRVLKYAKTLMKPGILMADFHSQVCNLWQEEHIRLGLYTSIEAKNYKAQPPIWFKYFMHGTSHSIGLDVHDMFDKTEKFQAGMVFSCEPSIYIKEEGLGIRLENDILITENGNVDLMEDVPVEREEIQELMKKG
jgi:Xaa-Pro aminopeptidase